MKNVFQFIKHNMVAILVMAIVAFLSMAFGFNIEEGIMALAAGPLVSTSPDRAAYGRFDNYLKGKGIVGNGSAAIITPTDIRLEAELTPNKNAIKLDLKKGTSSTDRPMENKLNTNDIFFVTAIGIGIYKQADASQNPGPIFTHPDVNFFSNAGEADALRNIYNGKLFLNTESTTRLNGVMTHNMLFVPPVQYDATVAGGVTHPSYGAMLEERGVFRINPNIIIDGSQTNEVELVLGAGDLAAIAGASGSKNYLVVFLHGFKFSGQVASDQCLV